MAKKQSVKEEVVEVMDNVNETVVLDDPVEKVVEEVKKDNTSKINVLSRYRVEKVNNDAYIYERIKVPETYAGQKNVKEFVEPNGNIIYYVEKLVKKYSENVVQA